MAILGKLLGGVAGFALGGPIGALLGAAAGHRLDSTQRPAPAAPGQTPRLTLLIDHGFALMGHIAKADGRVSEAEIAAAEAWMQRLRLDAAQRRRAMDRFALGKQADFSVPGSVAELRAGAGSDLRVLQTVLQMQVSVAQAEGQLSAASRRALAGVLGQLGLPAALLDALLGQAQNRRPRHAAQPRIDQDYAVLGVPADADPATIKRAYRRLMARHHPDRAGNDPAATARAQAINDAYRRIREARGF
jgi:DnaJ like chaperone protein